ncbi:MAG: hypothetical protein ABIR98_01345 [Usitatibacter sp.]
MASNARIERLTREALGPRREDTHLPRSTFSILGLVALVVVSACAVVGRFAMEAEAAPVAPIHSFVGVPPAAASTAGELHDMTF